MAHACPHCESRESAKTTQSERKSLCSSYLVRPRKCLACGCLWEPAAPIWALFLVLVAGVPVLALGLFIFFSAFGACARTISDNTGSAATLGGLIGGGVWFVLGGVTTLVGLGAVKQGALGCYRRAKGRVLFSTASCVPSDTSKGAPELVTGTVPRKEK